jgi:hypothetical protein
MKTNAVPYMEMADANGNALIVSKSFEQGYKSGLGNGKLMDWNYYPLTDWQHFSGTGRSSEIILNVVWNKYTKQSQTVSNGGNKGFVIRQYSAS